MQKNHSYVLPLQEKTLNKQAEAERRNLKNLVEKLKKEKEKLQNDGQSKLDEMIKQMKEKVIRQLVGILLFHLAVLEY